MKRRKTADALEIVHRRYYEGRPERQKELAAARQNAVIARELYKLRSEACLTQRELAERTGTTTSVISRLENADYEGHSLTMLRRVANAFGMDVEVHFVERTRAVR